MKFAIDAGHGHNTPGKRVPDNFSGYSTAREWDLNSKIADKVAQALRMAGHVVIRTDDITGVTDVSLSKRVSQANTAGVDFFLSIHHNAGVNGGKGGGVVVYTYSELGKKRAQALYDSVIASNGNKGNRAKHVNYASFTVLKKTKMPALLIENGFMDSQTDIKFLDTDDYRDKTVTGILNFFHEYYGVQFPMQGIEQLPNEPDVPGQAEDGCDCNCGCGCCTK